MFRLIRFFFSLLMFAVLIWFATTVPLGKRTLWGHLRAIWGTPEAQDLAHGTVEEAKKVAGRVREGAAPAEKVDERDRRKLDELVREKQ
jgi:hypothetical protein